jgi:hypothetical protein
VKTSPYRRRPLGALAVAALLLACGGGADERPVHDPSILGANAAEYVEANESGNGTASGSEVTAYTLDADGLRIAGAFEASGTTPDQFRFNTGSYKYIDVQVFVDGVKQREENFRVTISLDSYVDDGYSTLMGHGYFSDAWMSGTMKDYVLAIYGASAAGATYVIELKGG